MAVLIAGVSYGGKNTVKPWYSGLWNSGISWNNGQNCADHFSIK